MSKCTQRPVDHRALVICLCMVMALLAGQAALAADAGMVQVSRGAVSAQSAAGLRLLGARAAVQAGDKISTGRKSFAIVRMNDDTRLVLRPDTEFEIEGWDAEPQRESALIRLVKGGLRAVTGSISKRNPNAWRIRTSVATIGIRGTEFDVRECDAECVIEANKFPAVGSRTSLVAARIGAMIGTASALGGGENAKRRALTRGGPIYEGDTLSIGKRSYVVVVFSDKSRVTLTSSSEFKVETFQYAGNDDDSSFFRLLRGGMRALTGAIGQRNKGATKYATAAATIGIRGTGFDAVCTEEESADPNKPDCYITPWQGSIALELDEGDVPLDTGDIVTLQPGETPRFIDEMPFALDGPRPDEVDIDDTGFFDTVDIDDIQEGVLVSCYEGHCIMNGVDLGAGETGYAGPDGVVSRIGFVPQFLDDDPYLELLDTPPDQFSLLTDDFNVQSFECSVQ